MIAARDRRPGEGSGRNDMATDSWSGGGRFGAGESLHRASPQAGRSAVLGEGGSPAAPRLETPEPVRYPY